MERYGEDYWNGYGDLAYALLSFLSTLESEKPIEIDFEQELYKHFGQVKDFTLGMRIGKYFYALGKQSGSSEIPNDLEEAAGDYASDSTGFIDMTAYRAFIAGAKLDRSQMLKEAMECELYYDGDFLAIDLNMAELGYSERDKVRVIILKED